MTAPHQEGKRGRRPAGSDAVCFPARARGFAVGPPATLRRGGTARGLGAQSPQSRGHPTSTSPGLETPTAGHRLARGARRAGVLAFGLVVALLAAPASAEEQTLAARLLLRPTLIDYELPGHPLWTGRTGSGTLGAASLVWSFGRVFTAEAGVLGRLPFAHNFEDEAGAFPILAFTVSPFGPWLSLRFGSLDIRHGFHPAILDEQLYAYGRSYQEAYNRSLVPEAQRDLGGDPFMPVENGAQLRLALDPFFAEVYLDWQLLETEAHREKFAVGVLGEYQSRWVDAAFQMRLNHYGGQLFTRQDPIRAAGLDPKRQPTTFGFLLRPRPVAEEAITLELPLAFILGRVAQAPGEPERRHQGFEAGADLWLFSMVRLGYRFWYPDGGRPGWVSEDADPVYLGPTSHRASVELRTSHGIVDLGGRLDLVFARGTDKVQYLTVSTLTFRFEPVIFSTASLP